MISNETESMTYDSYYLSDDISEITMITLDMIMDPNYEKEIKKDNKHCRYMNSQSRHTQKNVSSISNKNEIEYSSSCYSHYSKTDEYDDSQETFNHKFDNYNPYSNPYPYEIFLEPHHEQTTTMKKSEKTIKEIMREMKQEERVSNFQNHIWYGEPRKRPRRKRLRQSERSPRRK